jgi:hypothetical protein
MYVTYHIHPSDLVGVQEVKWDKGGTVRTGVYVCFSMEKETKIDWKFKAYTLYGKTKKQLLVRRLD